MYTALLTAFEQDRTEFHPGPVRKLSTTYMTYTIAECTVNKLLMMDKGTVRNMQNFMTK